MKKKSLIIAFSMLGMSAIVFSGIKNITNKIDNSPAIVLADELDDYKAEAIDLIQNYVDENEYGGSSLRQLHAWIEYGISEINSAGYEEEIDEIVHFVCDQIDQIFKGDLDFYKVQAKDFLNNYADRREYDEEGNWEIDQILRFCCGLIDEAENCDDVDRTVEFGKAEIDNVLTASEKNDFPPVPGTIYEARAEGLKYVAAKIAGLVAKTADSGKSYLNFLEGFYTEEIPLAGSIDEVYCLLENFKNELSLVPLKEDTLENSVTKHAFLLRCFVDLRDGYYTDENYEIVRALGNKAISEIRKAATIDEVVEIYNNAVNSINSVNHILPFPEVFYKASGNITPGRKDPSSEPEKNNVALIIVSVVGAVAITFTILGFVKLLKKDMKKVTE